VSPSLPEKKTTSSGHGLSCLLSCCLALAVCRQPLSLQRVLLGGQGFTHVAVVAAAAHRLKEVSASQGLMLESSSQRLLAPGGPHHNCPDKLPESRLQVLEAAGQAGVPFTTGKWGTGRPHRGLLQLHSRAA
jgi:hypothetical protein